jgi:hypothetical protein
VNLDLTARRQLLTDRRSSAPSKNYEGYSESSLRLFQAANLGAGESSRMRGNVNHHVTGHLVFVLVSTERVIMCSTMIIPPVSSIAMD